MDVGAAYVLGDRQPSAEPGRWERATYWNFVIGNLDVNLSNSLLELFEHLQVEVLWNRDLLVEETCTTLLDSLTDISSWRLLYVVQLTLVQTPFCPSQSLHSG